MDKKKISRDLRIMLISTLVTVAIWVGFEVYRAYARVDIPKGLERHLVPFDPNLDENVLREIERRSP